MKIYFCDSCNESIPLPDIKSNKITIDQGKIYCKECAPTPSRTEPVALRTWMLVAMVLVGIGIGVVVMAVWGDTLFRRSQRETLSERVARMESASGEVQLRQEERMAALEKNVLPSQASDGSYGHLALVKQSFEAQDAEVRQLKNTLDGTMKEIRNDIAKSQKAVEALGTRIDRDFARLDKAMSENVVEDLQRINEELNDLRDRAQLIDGRMATVESLGSTILKRNSTEESKVAAKEDPKISAELQAEVDKRLRELGSDDAGIRYAAAVWFTEIEPPIRNRRVEQALVDVLDDKSDFVVTGAMASLVHMKATWVIPHAIDQLKTDNTYIVDEAIAAIESLGGIKVGIDSTADRGARLAKMRELMTWWKENESRFT